MIRVPLLQSVQPAGQLAPTRSMSDGTAGMSATKELAQLAGQVGQNIFAEDVRLQRIENERKVNDLKLGMRQAQAQFEIDKFTNHDPETWQEKHREAINGFMGSADINSLPPEAREAWDDWSGKYQSDQSLQVGRDSALATIRRSEARLQNNLSAYVEGNNFGAAREEVMGSSLMSPEEKTATLAKLDRQEQTMMQKQRVSQLEADIAANPFEVEKNIEAGQYHDLDPELKQRAIAKLRSAKNQITGDAVDLARDGMADGTIIKTEQIDEMFPGIPARVRESLKNEMGLREKRLSEAQRALPEFQQKTVGEVETLIDGLESADEQQFQDRYATAAFMIDELPDSPTKRRLDETISAAKSGRKANIESGAQQMREELKTALPRILPDLQIEPEKEEISIQKAVSDGLFRDPVKLRKMFGENQEAIDAVLMTQTGQKPSASAMADAIRAEFGKLPPEEQEDRLEELSPIDRQVFEGIRDGKGFSSVVSYTSPEAEDAATSRKLAAQQRQGRISMQLDAWLASPEGMKSTAEQKSAKIYEISSGEIRKGAKFFEDGPKSNSSFSPQGADENTSIRPNGSNLLSMVKDFEAGGARDGFHRSAYWDYGQWSIGYGTKSKKGEVISKAEAESRLNAELAGHRSRVDKAAAKYGYEFSPHEKDALTSFDYNTGKLHTLLDFGNRDKSEIAEKMLLYRNADGQRLRGLERRRQAERHLFLNGYEQK